MKDFIEVRLVKFFLFFYMFWVFLSGNISLEVLFLGLFVIFLVTVFCYKMNIFSLYKSGKIQLFYLGKYYSWLLKEAGLSALAVSKKIVLFSNLKKTTRIYKLDKLKNTVKYQIMLSHSITLTPGTLVITSGENSLLVHTMLSNNSEVMIKEYVDFLEKSSVLG